MGKLQYLGGTRTFSDTTNRFPKFRQKKFSIIGNVLTGAGIGGAIGAQFAGGNQGLENEKPAVIHYLKRLFHVDDKYTVKPKDPNDNSSRELSYRPNGNLAIVGGTIIGAGLGLIYGLTKKAVTGINRAKTVNDRLMEDVVSQLKKTGFKEGTDFTRDPSKANILKTKVCIVITRVSGEMQLMINSVFDPKLKNIISNLNMPNSSVVTKKVSDKYNDITVSNIPDSTATAGFVAGMAEQFIRNKYPVYLIEVG